MGGVVDDEIPVLVLHHGDKGHVCLEGPRGRLFVIACHFQLLRYEIAGEVSVEEGARRPLVKTSPVLAQVGIHAIHVGVNDVVAEPSFPEQGHYVFGFDDD